ncbi:MAG: hypothetical protein IJR03_01985 [Bacteroidales bacterium]|nr:hypothetical protein [Bacteroidales bacterium]
MKKFWQIVLLVLCTLGILITIFCLCGGIYISINSLRTSPSPLGTLIGMGLAIAFWIWILRVLLKGFKNILKKR